MEAAKGSPRSHAQSEAMGVVNRLSTQPRPSSGRVNGAIPRLSPLILLQPNCFATKAQLTRSQIDSTYFGRALR